MGQVDNLSSLCICTSQVAYAGSIVRPQTQRLWWSLRLSKEKSPWKSPSAIPALSAL